MRTLVVYESMFGNTRQVAEAVADGLGTGTVEVGAAPHRLAGIDLVVVGGPTHAFGMSRPATREDAARRGAPAPGAVGVREWLDALEPAAGTVCATFDTRVGRGRFPGSAARKALRRMRHAGLRAVAPPQSFWVADTPGPLLPGEVDRARAWGRELAAALAASRDAAHRPMGPGRTR